MVALMSEIELIAQRMMMVDYREGCIGGLVTEYVQKAVTFILGGGAPSPCVCECRPQDRFICRWHIPHIDYLHGFAEHIISIELYILECKQEVDVTPEHILSTCHTILTDDQDRYHIALNHWLDESLTSFITQFSEY